MVEIGPEDLLGGLDQPRMPEQAVEEIAGAGGEAMAVTVDVSDEALSKKVLKNDLYLARIRDDVFSLDVPKSFRPKSYAAAA